MGERSLQELFDAVEGATEGDITLEEFDRHFQQWAGRGASAEGGGTAGGGTAGGIGCRL